MRSVHGEGEKQVICSFCGKDFKTLLRVQKHEEICQETQSGQDKPQEKEAKMEFQCPKCPKKFVLKGQLKPHMRRIHSIGRSFICGQCGKGFKSESEVDKHKTTHEEKKLKCDLCDLKFRASKHLEQHRMRHTGERPNVCPYCHHGFIQLSVCKSHILKIHGVVVPKGMNMKTFSDSLSKEDE